jgi:hypothetical protein
VEESVDMSSLWNSTMYADVDLKECARSDSSSFSSEDVVDVRVKVVLVVWIEVSSDVDG